MIIVMSNTYFSPFLRKSNGHCSAYALTTSCNNGNFTFQAEIFFILFVLGLVELEHYCAVSIAYE